MMSKYAVLYLCKNNRYVLQALQKMVRRVVVVTCFVMVAIGMSLVSGNAQNCSNLLPLGAGQDDWANIDNCLKTAPYSATLSSGTFLVSKPIVFYASNSTLLGQGRASTTIKPMSNFACTLGQPNFVIDVNGQQVSKDTVTIKRFYLDLTALPSSCSHEDSYAIRLLRSHNLSNIQGLTIQNGSTGIGGVRVIKSKNAQVQFTKIFDTNNGIQVEDSPNVTIYSTDIARVGTGITVENNAGADFGGEFDSSGANISLNSVTDAANRAMRLRSRGAGALRLRNVVVFDNDLLNFGNIGLYLISGVTGATISNNTVTGSPTSNFALWVGGVDPDNNVVNPCFDNQINNNGFIAGKYDVSFNGDPIDPAPPNNNIAGPDQPSISRLWPGSNALGATGIEPLPAIPCGQYAHAWWNYKNGLNYVPQGGKISLAAAGTREFSTVTYKITAPGGNPNSPLAQFATTVATNSVCVINQHDSPAINLAPGFYDVYVDLTDGNGRYPDANLSNGVRITDWKLTIQLEVR